jgi:hypothetical protein
MRRGQSACAFSWPGRFQIALGTQNSWARSAAAERHSDQERKAASDHEYARQCRCGVKAALMRRGQSACAFSWPGRCHIALGTQNSWASAVWAASEDENCDQLFSAAYHRFGRWALWNGNRLRDFNMKFFLLREAQND